MDDELHTRLADAVDAEALWALYQRTGFLYPQKLEAMQDGGRQARATFESLLTIGSEDFRVVTCWDKSHRLRSACTYARFTDTQTWLMHLVSDHDRRALLHAVVAAGNGAIASPTGWTAYTFRESNTSVQQLFTSPIRAAVRDGWSLEFDTYELCVVTGDRAQQLRSLTPARVVQPATETDRQMMLRLLEGQPSEQAALEAQGLLQWGGGALADRFASAGLRRERAALVVHGDDGPVGLAVLDIAPPWWNLCNLSTGLRLWQTQDDPEVTAALIAGGARWFAERAIDSWTVLVGPAHGAARRLLEGIGATTGRRYQRLGVPDELFPVFVRSYARFIGRSMELPPVLPAQAPSRDGITRIA